MKNVLVLSLLVVGFGTLEAQLVPAGGEKKIRPRMTHEELSKLQRPKNPELEGRTVKLADLKRNNVIEDPEKAAEAAKRRESLVKRSTIVSGGASWTLVPRGAVLSIPDRFSDRVNGERNGKLVSWRDFYAKNNRWIRLLPVTIEQATGENPFTPEYLESLQKTGLLVVAVCKGGPISVHLPKEGDEPPKVSKPVKAAEWKSPARR